MSTDTGHDGVHDPSQRPTEPLNGETTEERQARLGESQQGEQDVEAEQQKRADKRSKHAAEEAEGGKTYTSRKDAP